MTQPLLEIKDLRTYFHSEGSVVKAVDGISLRLENGKTLGIVGESGSGKSVTSFTVMKLLSASAEIASGSIAFLGRDLVHMSEPEMRKLRGAEISMIFQEPMTSLNPVFTAGYQVKEAILIHEPMAGEKAKTRTLELFSEVGLDDPLRIYDSYPHQLSGGQKQRVMIAMALSCEPKLLIADEPTTALDVTIQAQILDLLRSLRDSRGMSVLFITHDLGVIAEIADDVAVMYRGRVVEYGPVLDIFERPRHPYTKGLLACRPRPSSEYRLLPTVADFMEVTEKDGETQIVERTPSDDRWKALRSYGRGRRLHPPKHLEEMGRAIESGVAKTDAEYVSDSESPLLVVQNLRVYFPIRRGFLMQTVGHKKAVDGVSFSIYRGQTLGLVGESGCGKTTTGRAILRLIEPTDGVVSYNRTALGLLSPGEMRRMRRKMQIIFQDPYGSMNPRMTIESILTEPMIIHSLAKNGKERRDRAVALLEEVDLRAEHLGRYPHEFSGGQRQRICIARALAVEPEFIICDESVSALDVSVQAQVLNLLKRLQLSRSLTYIFISHDLAVVKFMSDMMAVMNEGKIVEMGPSDDIYANPREEYTRRLIAATPNDNLDNIRRRQAERQGRLPNPQ